MVGLGKCREYIEHAQRLGISDRVKFVGPTRDMNQVYAASDALLLPTFYDSFGFVGIEALNRADFSSSARDFSAVLRLFHKITLPPLSTAPKMLRPWPRRLDCLPN